MNRLVSISSLEICRANKLLLRHRTNLICGSRGRFLWYPTKYVVEHYHRRVEFLKCCSVTCLTFGRTRLCSESIRLYAVNAKSKKRTEFEEDEEPKKQIKSALPSSNKLLIGAPTSNPSLPPPVMTWGEWIRSPEAIKNSIHREYCHYRDGFKLLYLNVLSTCKILKHMLQGESVTRRERELLVRTASDLFRMVPFLIMIIVPFMELLFPLFIALDLLPSTFTDKLKRQENIQKQLYLKIETARFLQETLEEMSNDAVKYSPELREFLDKLRSGQGVGAQEFFRYAKLFRDDITLDSLDRHQLLAICKLLGIKNFGNDTFLRMQIRRRIESLKKDDQSIMEEGIESLSLEELQMAVYARGMWSQSSNRKVLEKRLLNWLDMSINKTVPITWLILSRAFALNSRAELVETLRNSLRHVPVDLIEELEMRIDAKTIGRKADRSFKVEALLKYTQMIEEERAAQMQNNLQEDNVEKFEALATLAAPTELERMQIRDLRQQINKLKKEIENDMELDTKRREKLLADIEDEKMAEYQANESNGWKDMTHELFESKWKAYRDKALSELSLNITRHTAEFKNLKKLEVSLERLLAELNNDLEAAKIKLEEELKLLDKNYDGLISEEELKFALNSLHEKFTDEDIKNLLDKLDVDHDGLIEVKHLLDCAMEMNMDTHIMDAVMFAAKERAIDRQKTPSDQ